MNNNFGSLMKPFANDLPNYWQIASLVTQKSLFVVTHALFFICMLMDSVIIACGNRLLQCYRKTFMVHQTFVRWTLYILFKIVKSLIRHLGLAMEMSDMTDVFHEHCLSSLLKRCWPINIWTPWSRPNFLPKDALKNVICKLSAIMFWCQCVNPSWLSDTIWRQSSGWILAQVMACCLQHQAITWTSLDFSLVWSCGIYLRVVLTHWGLVTPFGDIDLGQHWFR